MMAAHTSMMEHSGHFLHPEERRESRAKLELQDHKANREFRERPELLVQPEQQVQMEFQSYGSEALQLHL